MTLDTASSAVVRVGGGRGFVIEVDGDRLIVTAAHCLPQLPPAHPAACLEERTYAKLIGRLEDEEPAIWCECLFVDPVADLAVLGSPDNQELWEEAEAYDALVESAVPLRLGSISFTRERHVFPPIPGSDEAYESFGPPQAKSAARLLSLDGKWFPCEAHCSPRALLIMNAAEDIRAGMSGSPILAPDGTALGVVSVAASVGGAGLREGGPNPLLAGNLPGWMLSGLAKQEVP